MGVKEGEVVGRALPVGALALALGVGAEKGVVVREETPVKVPPTGVAVEVTSAGVAVASPPESEGEEEEVGGALAVAQLGVAEGVVEREGEEVGVDWVLWVPPRAGVAVKVPGGWERVGMSGLGVGGLPLGEGNRDGEDPPIGDPVELLIKEGVGALEGSEVGETV